MTVQAQSGDELTGLSGVIADIIAELGEVGVGVATLVENLFPPIPSEVILPFAGYLAEQGRLNLSASSSRPPSAGSWSAHSCCTDSPRWSARNAPARWSR